MIDRLEAASIAERVLCEAVSTGPGENFTLNLGRHDLLPIDIASVMFAMVLVVGDLTDALVRLARAEDDDGPVDPADRAQIIREAISLIKQRYE